MSDTIDDIFGKAGLQWGRLHAKAECLSVVFGYSQDNRLQWGRLHAKAECLAGIERYVGGVHASMGPPSCEGGMNDYEFDEDGNRFASMGPPSCEGGMTA